MKKYKCVKQFPDFMWSFNGNISECPGRNVDDIFNVMDMKDKPYQLLLKKGFITEVL